MSDEYDFFDDIGMADDEFDIDEDEACVCCGYEAHEVCSICGLPMCFGCHEMNGGICDMHAR